MEGGGIEARPCKRNRTLSANCRAMLSRCFAASSSRPLSLDFRFSSSSWRTFFVRRSPIARCFCTTLASNCHTQRGIPHFVTVVRSIRTENKLTSDRLSLICASSSSDPSESSTLSARFSLCKSKCEADIKTDTRSLHVIIDSCKRQTCREKQEHRQRN